MRQFQPFERYLIHEFVQDYRDGLMSRRDMIRRILLITGGIATTATVLTSLGITPLTRAAYAQETTPVTPNAQSPLSVAADDSRVVGADISFEGNETTLLAYAVKPAGTRIATPVTTGLPVVLICHENRGLTEHIRDVTRRWAVEGYYAIAVDLLSRSGGIGAITDAAEIPSLLTSGVDPTRHVGDFQAAIEYLRADPVADIARLAMTGFCFGGGITWRAATAIQELKAAAPYYGPPPPLEDVHKIKAAMIGIYSDDSGDFANEGRDELVAALEAAGVVHQINVYPNTQHAFNNDTGARYNEEASLQAWADVTAWFAEHV